MEINKRIFGLFLVEKVFFGWLGGLFFKWYWGVWYGELKVIWDCVEFLEWKGFFLNNECL